MLRSDPPDKLWGIHALLEYGDRFIADSFVSLGWAKLGDFTKIPASRDQYKQAIAKAYPDAKQGAIPVWAGVVFRFAHEMRIGDGIIFPSKHDRLVNLGIVEGEAEYHRESEHEGLTCRRRVRWIKHIPRTSFSQVALNEIGSALTLFLVANNQEEFRAAFAGETFDPAPVDEKSAADTSEQVEESTDDFVLKRLKSSVKPNEFEQFVAHLLRAMGYFARVTRQSGDGGVDIVAHRDELGIDPPRIHVQCKQKVEKTGRPEIQKLHGAVPAGDHGMFVSLGAYTDEAQSFEQTKGNLRLIDGKTLTELIYKYYDKLDASAKVMVPLRKIFVPESRQTTDGRVSSIAVATPLYPVIPAKTGIGL